MPVHAALRALLLVVVATSAAAVGADANSFLQVFSGVGNHAGDRVGDDGDTLVAEWVGCFRDDADRDLEWNPQGHFTVSGCKNECYYTNYKFMALQGGNECWCGNSYETSAQYFQMVDSECDSACIPESHPEGGNSSAGGLRQLCGGHFANAVYKLKMQKSTEVPTTMTTYTKTTATATTVTVSTVTGTTTSYTQKVKEADTPSLSELDICEDKSITSLTINGEPQPCSSLRHYCGRRNFTKTMESECPATCNLCKPTWIGCFRDDTVEHDLEKKPPGKHTTRSCMQACSGFLYMALQNSSDCWCGMKYSTDATRFFPMLDTDCGPICPGEEELSPPRHCGKALINAVYKLPAVAPPAEGPMQEDDTSVDTADDTERRLFEWPAGPVPNISSWVGCYEDKEERAFVVQAVGKHVTETCLRECTNYSYMALENMGTCWCGNTYDANAMKTLPMSDCGDVCHGEAGMVPVRFCGGKHASAVYRLVRKGEESSATSASVSDGELKAERVLAQGDAAPAAEPASVAASSIVATFEQMDTNGDSRISVDELLIVLQLTSDGWDKEQVANMIKKVDRDGSGALEFTEFSVFFTSTDLRAMLGLPMAEAAVPEEPVGVYETPAAVPEMPAATNATATVPVAAAPASLPYPVLAGNDTARNDTVGRANVSFEAPARDADPWVRPVRVSEPRRV